MPWLARILLLAVSAALLGGSPAVAHDAPMPPGLRHGLLPNERWVMQHWSPLDEQTLAHALRMPLPQVEAFLYNDHHTLAQLAIARCVNFETLVSKLSAWTENVPNADPEVIKQRIRPLGSHRALRGDRRCGRADARCQIPGVVLGTGHRPHPFLRSSTLLR